MISFGSIFIFRHSIKPLNPNMAKRQAGHLRLRASAIV
jgi:hypothetical protein